MRSTLAPMLLTGVMFTLPMAQAQQYVISTYAGGAPPPTPIAGPNLAVRYPQGMATDAAGRAYFAMLNCVFRIGTDGSVDRIAGTCRPGYSGDGGPALDAQFRLGAGYLNPPPYYGTALPIGMAIDQGGNLFIADTGNYRVRRVSPDGTISTVAGNGVKGFSGDGGPATAAQLSEVAGLAVNGSGDLFIADFANHRVRIVSSGGTISTVAGDGTCGRSGDGGPAAAAELCLPAGLAADAAGNLFIADSGNGRIRRVSLQTRSRPAETRKHTVHRTIDTVVGCVTPTDSLGGCGVWKDGVAATQASLDMPTEVAVDRSGNLFIADTVWDVAAEDSWQAVRKVTPGGIVTTLAGGVCTAPQQFNCRRSPLFDGTTANRTFLNGPLSLAPGADGGLIIADGLTKVLKVINDSTIITIAGNNGSPEFAGDGGPAIKAQLSRPMSLAADNRGDLFVYEGWNMRVRKISAEGIISTAAGAGTCCSTSQDGRATSGDGGPATSAQFCATGLATDSSANLLIADSCGHRVREVTGDGIIKTIAGNGNPYPSPDYGDGGPALDAALWSLASIANDREGNLFIGEFGRIRKVRADGIIDTIAGDGNETDSGDGGPAIHGQVRDPEALAVDGDGNLFIADTRGHRIRKISRDGIISTVAGTGEAGYSGDGGPATDAQINTPTGIAVDGSGNIFIADYGNGRIRRVSTDGAITTIAGNGTHGYCGDGQLANSACIGAPLSVAVDARGNIYFSDDGNDAVRVLRPVN